MSEVALTIDGTPVTVASGTTLLEACRSRDLDQPTLCYLETLTPVNVCRVCVVEVEGSRTLVPSCSREVEEGMVVATDSDRVRQARKVVFELLASSVRLDLVDDATRNWMEDYGVDADRFGPPAEPVADRSHRRAGHHAAPTGATETVHQAPKVDNELYMRDYSNCILCYKCVEACGEDAQNTFAITVAGRGFDAHISTEFDVMLGDSACVFCGNCVAVCPTGALMFRSEYELRQAGVWDESRQTVTRTVCSFCGVGCNLDLHVQDNRIVKALAPFDHPITEGNLCVKGRFGYDYVQSLPDDLAITPVDEVLRQIRAGGVRD